MPKKPYFFKKKTTYFSFQCFLNHDLITCLRVLGAIRTWTIILFNGSWGVGRAIFAQIGWKRSEEERNFQEFFRKKNFPPFLPKFSKIQSQWVVSSQITAQQDHLAYSRHFSVPALPVKKYVTSNIQNVFFST